MRTSRVSQDTARIMSVLSPRRSSTRIAKAASLKSSPEAVRPGKKVKTGSKAEPVNEARIKTEDSDSELSDLSNPHDDQLPTPEASVTTSTVSKRKRGSSVKAEPDSNESSSFVSRRSPRKIGVVADLNSKVEFENDDGLFPRPTRRLPSKRIKGPTGDISVEPPPNWERVYNITAEMRKRRVAAVDTMGCENLADDKRSPLDRRLQTLIALMLSSQTKDPVTAAAIKNMQDNLPRGFCLEDLLEVAPARLNELICKVGFHNNKTKYIKATAEILRDKWGGDIPDTIEGMISLPGVGPKMAYLCMSSAWGRDEGIGVDVHVHRITNLWGWHKTRTPEETRAELESWLPREKWHDINHLLVGFGQTYCPPVGRRCEGCDLAREGLCPSAVVPKELKRKVKREKVDHVDGDESVKKEEDAEIKTTVLIKANEEAPPLNMTPSGEAKGEAGIKQEVVTDIDVIA
ncbi:DNA glycosylase [Myriangium duriaei CBS 260.36]|uniref:Endonuclease III homolog n=1 Tax=Myriangium duriaei CBS 260.36 TaxID=1168546 RepID=A0A9P4MI95_9PEZI|nr:DNA glycosylase [Myriangium duriaei CBS 260.36]